MNRFYVTSNTTSVHLKLYNCNHITIDGIVALVVVRIVLVTLVVLVIFVVVELEILAMILVVVLSVG